MSSFLNGIILRHRAELYGILAIWIMIFHLNIFFNPLLGNIFLGRIASLGESCVDVFLFVSGYCIYHSWTKLPCFPTFFSKRISRIIPSYLIITAPYFLWKDFVIANQSTVIEQFGCFLFDLSGLSFLIQGQLDAWFPVAIMLFYLITPPLARIFSNRLGYLWFIAILGTIVILIITNDYFSKTSIMWARLPAYSLGVLFATNSSSTKASNTDIRPIWLFLCIIILLAFVLFHIISSLGNCFGPGAARVIYLFLIIPILVLFEAVIRFLPKALCGILRFCGGLSFEIYLIHLFLLYIISYYGLNVWLYPIALIASIPLSYSSRLIAKQCQPKL